MKKPSRINLCSAIRTLLIANSISTVGVVNAINATLSELEAIKSESKTGDSKVNKSFEYSVSVTENHKFKARCTVVLLFDAWNTAIAKAENLASFDLKEIPVTFGEWLKKFAVKKGEEVESVEA
jgi:hypothetical protein